MINALPPPFLGSRCRSSGISQMDDDDTALFLQRPVSAAAIDRLRVIVCKNDECRKKECLALKAALLALRDELEA